MDLHLLLIKQRDGPVSLALINVNSLYVSGQTSAVEFDRR
jgi:hypothetical protein